MSDYLRSLSSLSGFREAPASSTYVALPKPLRLQDLAPPVPKFAMPDSIHYQEARVMPVPQSIGRTAFDIAMRNILNGNAEKLAKETIKGVGELRDSANSFMYRATNPSEELINELVANRLRKFGK
jgi:hypothetical protein